jgi:hypothetical protein
LNAVFFALAARRLRMHNRLILEDVEVTPTPLGLMIVELAATPTLRTRPVYAASMPKKHMNLAFLQPKVNALDLPRRHNAEQFAEYLPVVHGCWMRFRRSRSIPEPLNSQKTHNDDE